MDNKSFTTTLLVDQPPKEAFDAINDVRGWWSDSVEGSTDKLNDEFIYRHKDMHYSRQKLIEVVPNKRVTWLVMDSSLSFIKNKEEWNGTRITFDISKQGDKTQIRITHWGLARGIECFDACSNGWNYYLHQSLLPLITTGKGKPDTREKKQSAKAKP